MGIEFTGNHYFNRLLRSRLNIYRKASRRGGDSAEVDGVRPGVDQEFVFGERISGSDGGAQALDNYKGKEGDLVIRFVIQREADASWRH